METLEYTIDAAGRTLGRVAAEAARALMGKASPLYTPHDPPPVVVRVSNARRIRISEAKRRDKVYTSYSGYPGGLKKESLGSLIGRKGRSEALRRAVERMLPRNRLRTARLKRLSISE